MEDPLVIDISWGVYEGKTYQEAFGDEKGGDNMFHPEKLIKSNYIYLKILKILII